MPIVSTLQGILLSVLPVFTQPSGQVFLRLVVGWVLCPTRRTVTGTIPYADPDGLRSHDTYHRFFRAAAWCRDAVRSTRQRTVHVWGLKIVPLCLRVRPPWGGEPLALPIAFRLYRKGGPTLLDLVEEMVNDVAAWFPDRTFTLTADGFYAPLAGRPLPRTHVISRMRRDAALYEMPPARRKGQRGRPRKKGKRLPSPSQMAPRVRKWKLVETLERGKTRTRLVYARLVLWYHVQPGRPVLLVISRDPNGKEKDDFFFTTDLDMHPATAISEFANRWPIEDTFRNTKSTDTPPLRSFRPPWYTQKSTPSFQDAIAALRKALWRERFFQTVGRGAQMDKFQELLINALARAA